MRVRYHYYSHVTNAPNKFINLVEGLESIMQDICMKDVMFKSPALKKAIVGRKNIIEMYKSVFRTSLDICVEISSTEEKELNGLVIISSNYVIRG